MEIPKYSNEVFDYIIAEQRAQLIKSFGPDFENNLDDIFPSTNIFLDYIDKTLDDEFHELTDERIDIEVQLKNNAFEDVTNLTKYEFSQYKTLLNISEFQFRKSVNKNYLDQIPYSATFHSMEPDAEIRTYDSLDKPIIFFHGGIYSANFMFCKLYCQLIKENVGETNQAYYTNLDVKTDRLDLMVVDLCAVYFYNYYFSTISNDCPTYELNTPFEKNILAIFLNSINLYIYSHEVAHWFLKHPLPYNDNRADEEKWKDEFEADRFAMIHLRNYCGVNNENILTLIAPLIFFRYRILLEKFNPKLGQLNSHPPTTERIHKYKQFLRRNIHDNDSVQLENFLNMEEKISDILSESFEKIHKSASAQFPDNMHT